MFRIYPTPHTESKEAGTREFDGRRVRRCEALPAKCWHILRSHSAVSKAGGGSNVGLSANEVHVNLMVYDDFPYQNYTPKGIFDRLAMHDTALFSRPIPVFPWAIWVAGH